MDSCNLDSSILPDAPSWNCSWKYVQSNILLVGYASRSALDYRASHLQEPCRWWLQSSFSNLRTGERNVVFLMFTMIADSLLWPNLALTVGWDPTSFSISELFYQIWFFSGIIGGIGARIVEVRGYTASSEITIAGFE